MEEALERGVTDDDEPGDLSPATEGPPADKVEPSVSSLTWMVFNCCAVCVVCVLLEAFRAFGY